ncbi:MAG: hypothetical protein AB7Q97_16940 [Gammaproteobacteria bacterium]
MKVYRNAVIRVSPDAIEKVEHAMHAFAAEVRTSFPEVTWWTARGVHDWRTYFAAMSFPDEATQDRVASSPQMQRFVDAMQEHVGSVRWFDWVPVASTGEP